MPPVGYLVPVYAVYALVSLGLTVWLARTLFKNGAIFLEDVFKDSPKMADAVNRLLVVGFYLINLGYAATIMQANGGATVIEAVEVLASKLGALLLSLGFMHFLNMYLFYRIRRRARVASLPPPVVPQLRMGPPTYVDTIRVEAQHAPAYRPAGA